MTEAVTPIAYPEWRFAFRHGRSDKITKKQLEGFPQESGKWSENDIDCAIRRCLEEQDATDFAAKSSQNSRSTAKVKLRLSACFFVGCIAFAHEFNQPAHGSRND
ncbi:MAG: hypothetical protein WCL11_04250 [Verrucomicrobiota bacterium]